MAYRPGKTCRDTDKPSWSRYSKRKPRKSFVKSRPHNALRHYDMGNEKDAYDVIIKLVCKDDVQLRANALESARMTVSKYLQDNTQQNYRFKIHVFPFEVIRETKRQTGAGADRVSSGMRKAFGRPTYRAVRLRKVQTLCSVKTFEKYENQIKEAYRKAQSKLSKEYIIVKESIKK